MSRILGYFSSTSDTENHLLIFKVLENRLYISSMPWKWTTVVFENRLLIFIPLDFRLHFLSWGGNWTTLKSRHWKSAIHQVEIGLLIKKKFDYRFLENWKSAYTWIQSLKFVYFSYGNWTTRELPEKEHKRNTFV